MLKKAGLILLMLGLSIGMRCSAQDARRLIAENPLRAAGALHAYEPLDTLFSAPPDGYKPFYISHFGRHGSRYHSSENKFRVVETLQRYRDKGLLTEEGETVLADLSAIYEASKGKYGDLTQKGARELEDIATRMGLHYPEVFSDTSRRAVIAISTVKQRVQDSRDCFINRLKSLYPELDVSTFLETDEKAFDGAHQEVRGHSPNATEKEFLSSISTSAARKRWSDSLDTSRLLKRWFTNTSGISGSIVRSVYNAGCIRQTMDKDDLPWIESYYLPKELFFLWCDTDISWFHSSCISEENRGIMAHRSGGGILEMMVRDADKAIRDGDIAAHLRFSHDVKLMPLLSAMGVEGADFTGPVEMAPEKMFTFQNICTAGNVQLVFYRDDGGSILVKILKNEKEVSIPVLACDSAPYYPWEMLRAYFLSR